MIVVMARLVTRRPVPVSREPLGIRRQAVLGRRTVGGLLGVAILVGRTLR
jgi:hypothetical protein